MKANKMFTNLGYHPYEIDSNLVVGYQKNSYKENHIRNIHFERDKTITICGDHVTKALSLYDRGITVEEHKAIHQQMKELGWL
jgi:hypothetical protein